MGESRSNPRSPAFLDPSPPRYKIGAMLDAIVLPSAKWQRENPAKEGEPAEALCPPEDMEVVVVIQGFYAEPTVLTTADKWPQGAQIIGELLRVPFLEWQRQIKQAPHNAGVKWRDREGEKPAEVDS